MDLEACKRHGLRVTRVPAYSPRSVAEHALALTFSLARNLHLSHQRVCSGNYALSGLVGFEARLAVGRGDRLRLALCPCWPACRTTPTNTNSGGGWARTLTPPLGQPLLLLVLLPPAGQRQDGGRGGDGQDWH